MKFRCGRLREIFLDENIAPSVVQHLIVQGHDALHVRDVEMSGSPDLLILAYAKSTERVLLSADTDFGDLLARSNDSGPSVLLWRRDQERRPAEMVKIIAANFDDFSNALENGAIVVIDDSRIRPLPLFNDEDVHEQS